MRHLLFSALFFLSSILDANAQVVLPDSIVTFLSESTNDSQFIIQLNKLAFDCLKSSPELGRELATQSIKFSKEIDFNEGYARALDIIGSSYWMVGDYETALKYYQLSAKTSRLINDSVSLSSVYHNMGEVYKKFGEYGKSIEFLTNSMEWDTKNNHHAITLYNIGEAYLFKNELSTAMDYYDQALAKAIAKNDNRTIAYCYQGLGTIKFKNKEYYPALAYFTQAEKLWNSQGEFRSLVQNYKDYADVCMSLRQFEKAEQYLSKGIALANKIYAPDLQINNYLKTSELFAMRGSFDKAYEWLGRHNALKDSVYNLKKTENINRMQTLFDTEARDQENRQLKAGEALKDSKIRSQQLLIIAFSFGLLIAGILALFLYKQHRRISEVNEILKIKTIESQQQKEEIELQTRALKDLNGQLQDLNKSLESRIQERTQQLIRQNEKLAEYAHANAHQLRAPVVSILGLLNLLERVQLQTEDMVLITHLQNCGKELDNITRTINRNLEE